jgi:hypothetical protein
LWWDHGVNRNVHHHSCLPLYFSNLEFNISILN